MIPARQLRYVVAVAVAALGMLVAGCSASEPDAAAPTTTARQVDPEAFAAEIASGERFVLNVHTPDEGSIDGTDADIAFDQLRQRASELPQDHEAPIAVYCRTGRMSEIAIGTLAELGYTDVVELRGGMVAWVADGRDLLPPG